VYGKILEDWFRTTGDTWTEEAAGRAASLAGWWHVDAPVGCKNRQWAGAWDPHPQWSCSTC